MASVQRWTPDPKTGRARYRALWRDSDGRGQSKVVGGRRPAIDCAQRMEAVEARGDQRARTVTVEQLLDGWLAGQGHIQASTAELWARLVRRHVLPQLGALRVVELRPSRIRSWVTGLQRQLAAGTARGVFDLLASALDAAVDDGLRADNPARARSVHPPAAAGGEVEPFDLAAAAEIVDSHPGRWRALAATAFGCGLRQGELFALAVTDIDWLGRQLHVRRQLQRVRGQLVLTPPKGGRRRKVPLPDSVSVQLAEHVRLVGAVDLEELPAGAGADNPGGFMFSTSTGRPLRASDFNAGVWLPAVASAGLPVGPRQNGMHRARHTWASLLLSEGESIAAVSEWAGHANQTVTLRVYSHLMPSSPPRARGIIDDAFAESSRGRRADAV